MKINPSVLREELLKTLKEVDIQIDELTKIATNSATHPAKIRDREGFPYARLLVAKTQILFALVELNKS